MHDNTIILPSKPKAISEDSRSGVYEIDGFYPGYGYTIGNSLRRIMLSSLTGCAISNIKIDGVNHEFSTIQGVKEDVITILLNLKQVRIKMTGQESQKITLKVKGVGIITAKDIKAPGQVEITNPDQFIAEITDKTGEISAEMTVERGIGFVTKEVREREKMDVGFIALDTIFTPIRRVNYEVENMRVGDRTDFNRLIINIDTDGTISPKEALERSIEIMINQLKAIVGFKEPEEINPQASNKKFEEKEQEVDEDFLKTRIENLDFSVRTLNSLSNANIRTIGGLARKKEKDILEIEGMGQKGLSEIKTILAEYGITLKN